jgi:hypothetical protein
MRQATQPRRPKRAWRIGRGTVCQFWFNKHTCHGYTEACLCKTELDRRTGTLAIVFDDGTLVLRGPAVHQFHKLYVNNRVRSVRADGRGILSIDREGRSPVVVAPPSPQADPDPADWWKEDK